MTFKTQLHIVIVVLSILIFSSCSEDQSVNAIDNSNKIFFSVRINSDSMDDSSGVYSMMPDGSNIKLVYGGGAKINSSPVNGVAVITKLYYSPSLDSSQLLLINLDGKVIKKLFTQKQSSINYAALSPDGKYVFFSGLDSKNIVHFIKIIDVATGQIYAISSSSSMVYAYPFSNNSQQVLYYDGISFSLIISSVRGTDQKVIASGTIALNSSSQSFSWLNNNASVAYLQSGLLKIQNIISGKIDTLVVDDSGYVYRDNFLLGCNLENNNFSFSSSSIDLPIRYSSHIHFVEFDSNRQYSIGLPFQDVGSLQYYSWSSTGKLLASGLESKSTSPTQRTYIVIVSEPPYTTSTRVTLPLSFTSSSYFFIYPGMYWALDTSQR